LAWGAMLSCASAAEALVGDCSLLMAFWWFDGGGSVPRGEGPA
jgi:hypothetical protein